jgi:hypothetical protein
MSEIEEAWDEFQSVPFPEGCVGLEVEGVELASLDTFAAGCIEAFVAGGGRLDPDRLSVLRQCSGELGLVVEKLDGEARSYFERLRLLTGQVLASVE